MPFRRSDNMVLGPKDVIEEDGTLVLDRVRFGQVGLKTSGKSKRIEYSDEIENLVLIRDE